MPKLPPRLATEDGTEVLSRPSSGEPTELAQAAPRKYFSEKALADFTRVWGAMNGKGES
jgi:hypothetical protein